MSDYLFIAAVLPVVLLCWFIYKKDVNKEPANLLIKIFVLGIASVVPVAIVESVLQPFFSVEQVTNFLIIFINVFIGIALVEEGGKWIITKSVGFDNKEFDEIYDIIVYAVFASLGFACLENIIYVFANGFFNAITRALLSIPGHTCFGVIMGYFFSQAKVNKISNNKSLYTKNIILSIVCPSLLHTMYDALIFYAGNTDSYVPIILFFIFDIAMVVFCFNMVNKISKIQQNLNHNVETGNIINNNGVIQLNNSSTKGDINFCPVCGKPASGANYCSSCGFKLK